ncbi:MAG: MarR family transcriptional regulator [Bacteroidales bacterium]
MLLIKKVGVYLNLTHFKFKNTVYNAFKYHNLDITPEQFLLIDSLWDVDAVSQQTVANFMHKDKNSITRLIDALEKKGFINRIADQQDRRNKLVKLTDKTRSLEGEITDAATQAVEYITKNISDKELDQFVCTMIKMANNIDKYEEILKKEKI